MSDEPTKPDLSDPFRVQVSRTVDRRPAVVFDAWLDEGGVGHWLFATPGGVMKVVKIDPRVGGRFAIAEKRGAELAEHHGEYLEIDRPRRLVFTFGADPSDSSSVVTVDVEPHGRGSRVTLTHRMDSSWADHSDRILDGWTGILDGLCRELERLPT